MRRSGERRPRTSTARSATLASGAAECAGPSMHCVFDHHVLHQGRGDVNVTCSGAQYLGVARRLRHR